MASATGPHVNAAPKNVDSTDKLRRRANRRLLGASVLLLIAIIAVPMFLEREPPPLPDNVDVRIPPVDGTKFEPKFPDPKKGAAPAPVSEVPVITEPSGAQAGTPPATSPAAAVAAKAATKEAAKEAPKESPKAPEKAAEKPAPEVAKEATKEAPKEPPKEPAKEPQKAVARKPGQLVVQLIAVRDIAAAKEASDKARALKFQTYSETIDVSNGKVTRVRVGPYDTKQAAENARAKLAQAGFEAKVITLQ